MSPYETVAFVVALIDMLVGVIALCYMVFRDNKK